MKKTLIVSMVAVMAATSANAGFWSKLGFGKKAEPKTIEEACNKDDLTTICPEVALGTKTLTECLAENVDALSKKCANFVKKSIADTVDAANAKVEETKAALEEKKAENEAAKAEQKAAIETQKQALKDSGKEVKDSVKQTGKELKETGKSIKGIFTTK